MHTRYVELRTPTLLSETTNPCRIFNVFQIHILFCINCPSTFSLNTHTPGALPSVEQHSGRGLHNENQDGQVTNVCPFIITLCTDVFVICSHPARCGLCVNINFRINQRKYNARNGAAKPIRLYPTGQGQDMLVTQQ